MRWQGGDRVPSRKRSLLCRLIFSWAELLTGTGNLEMGQTDSDSQDKITK